MTLQSTLSALPHDIHVQLADGGYAEEPRGRFSSQNGVVAAPADRDGVAAVLKYAHGSDTAVIPYGGGTGLVGGQVAQSDKPHIVLSLHRLNQIHALDPENATITVGAGAILADVQHAANDAGLLYPLSLAAEGSARIGGTLATNAGGVNVLRYGNARDLCLGLEVVLADGTIWNGLSGLRKDNTGYDLRNLMIGSEGSLGIITAATLRLFPKPQAFGTVMLKVASPAAAIQILGLARDRFGETISAFELLSAQGLAFLAETMPEVRQPFDTAPDWAVLMEIGGQDVQHIQDAILSVFETAAERGLATDAVLAQSDAQRADLWAVRENIPQANRKIGAVSSHDISVPVSAIPAFIAEGAPVLHDIGPFRINCFGHVGDGNLHYNVFPDAGKSRSDYDTDRPAIKRAVHDLVHKFNGSVSAEHGVGRLKVDDLERYSDPAKIAMMRSIKTALDPKGILNPGVIVRPNR